MNDTDKVMPFVRESFPEWAKYHALQIRKRKNKQGEDEYAVTDLSYNNPDQFVLDIISPLMVSAANGEDVTENLNELFKDVIIGTAEPFVDKSLALQYAQEMMGFIRADNPEIAADKLTRAYKISEPGFNIVSLDAGVKGIIKLLPTKPTSARYDAKLAESLIVLLLSP